MTVLLVAVGLSLGGPVLLACVGLAGLACVLAFVQLNLARLTLILTCAFAFSTGVAELHLGPVRLRLVLLVLATALSCLLLVWRALPPVPWWIITLAVALVLVTVLVALVPIDPSYLSGRTLDRANGGTSTGNTRLGASYLLSVLGSPLAVVTCALHFKRAPLWIAMAFVVGNSASALVAYTDYLGLTSLSATLGGCGVTGDRACGFSSHPVLLTIGTVYATALAAWFFVQRRYRWIGAACLPALILGTYASGTRGGVLSVLVAIAASVLLIPQYRRHFHIVALVAASAGTLVFVVTPSIGYELLVKMRLVDSPDASSSNESRIEAMTQGLHDFLQSPIYGIGLQFLDQAHNGYIQSMAAGGLILLTAMVTLNVAALSAAWDLMKSDTLAQALAATMIVRFGYELLEGSLVDYAAFVPVALIAGLLAQRHSSQLVTARGVSQTLGERRPRPADPGA